MIDFLAVIPLASYISEQGSLLPLNFTKKKCSFFAKTAHGDGNLLTGGQSCTRLQLQRLKVFNLQTSVRNGSEGED